MKNLISNFLLFVAVSQAVAEGENNNLSKEKRELAYAMQKAVLVDEDVNKVKELLESGFDITQPIGCGSYTALHGAVQTRNKEMIFALINAGAKPDGKMMLWAFSTYDMSLDIPRLLIDGGGDTTAFEHPYDTCLYSAVWHGNEPLVKLILSQDKLDIDRAGELGTPLCLAIRLGHVELAKLLLSKGADAKKRGHNKNSLSAAELIRKRIADLTELKQSIETKDEQSSAHQSTNRSKSKSE